MSDPFGVVDIGRSYIQETRNNRRRRRGNASNVVLVTEAKPRPMDGYQMVCTIENRSGVGISEMAVRLRMQAGSDLELDGERMPEAVHFASRALASQANIELRFPHIARLQLGSFEMDADRAGYQATLFWCDEEGKRWSRTDAGRAVIRPRNYPTRP